MDWDNIVSIVIAGAGLIVGFNWLKLKKQLSGAVKEWKDVATAYQKAMEDGVISQREATQIQDEIMEAVTATESLAETMRKITNLLRSFLGRRR